MTHYLNVDNRRESLQIIISSLELGLKRIEDKLNTVDWYDGIWALEESEPIIGMAFIAMQNYINKSIADYVKAYPSLTTVADYYAKDAIITGSTITQIQLIIALANYAKHEEGKLRPNTIKPIENVNLKWNDPDIEDSPLIKGIELLTQSWDIEALVQIATEWRTNLWKVLS